MLEAWHYIKLDSASVRLQLALRRRRTVQTEAMKALRRAVALMPVGSVAKMDVRRQTCARLQKGVSSSTSYTGLQNKYKSQQCSSCSSPSGFPDQ